MKELRRHQRRIAAVLFAVIAAFVMMYTPVPVYAEEEGPDGDPYMGMTFEDDLGEPDADADVLVINSQKNGTARSGYFATTTVLDVSHHQKSINWAAVKADGYDYAIIRIGYRGVTSGVIYEDNYWRQNLSGAISAGLNVGAYFYSGALNAAEAVEEAYFMLDRVSGYDIALPIFIDYEWEDSHRLANGGSPAARTYTICSFCETIKANGYMPGVYAGDYQSSHTLDTDTLAESYTMWIANYSKAPRYYSSEYDLWQYTSKEQVAGITGGVDASIYYMSNRFAPQPAPEPEPEPAPAPEPEPVVPVHVYTADEFPKSDVPDGVNMYRLYNPNSGEHFYTQNAEEAAMVANAGWSYEGVGWVAPVSGTPVYRLYNANAGDHHYTMDSNERDFLVSVGWTYEGSGWNSGGSAPLYRAYNPNAIAGAHNYTVNGGEQSNLVSVGWSDEGIGWYGLK